MKALLPVVFGTAVLLSGAAFAESTNTLTFKGEVTEQTCSVTINGSAANPVVQLPTVSINDLTAATSSAGLTTFTMGVSGCTADIGTLQIKTLFIGNNVTSSGNIGNTGTATSVELQLLSAPTGSILDLNSPTPVEGLSVQSGDTAAEHDFAVQYYTPTGNATPGTVVGVVQYSLSYL